MTLAINYLKRPRLRRSMLIAGLPGIANIGKLAAEYLIHELRAEKFAELYSEFFPEWAIREDGLLKSLRVDFFYSKPQGLKKDLIIATADAQASSPIGQYMLSSEVLDFVERYDVKEVVTMAAYAKSPMEVKPPVVGAATDVEVTGLISGQGVALLDAGMIVGMNGLLVGLAGMRGLQGSCLLGTTEGELIDVRATEAVLKTLTGMLGIKIDFEGLHEYASKIQKFMPVAPRGRPSGKEEASYIG